MARLSGIRLLILGTVLWALAVWIFGAPPPAETPAATETAAAPASTGATAGTGAGASGSPGIETTAASVPPAAADQPPAMSPNPDAAAGSPPLRTGSAGIAGAAPAPASAATGDGARIALAPASGGSAPSGGSAAPAPAAAPSAAPAGLTASDAAGTGARPAPGAPLPPRAPETGGARTGVDDSGIPPPPDPRFEHPLPVPPPPARPGGAAADGSAVAGAINAARRAAWEGRLVDALAHYRAAARIQPDLHVVWGEMGNVLWEMRRWSEAAYALEGAATLLVRAGELRAASELVPAVGRIDPEAAYRVQRLLWVAAQRLSG